MVAQSSVLELWKKSLQNKILTLFPQTMYLMLKGAGHRFSLIPSCVSSSIHWYFLNSKVYHMLTHSLTEGIGKPYLALGPQSPGKLLPRAATFLSFPSSLLSFRWNHFNTTHHTQQNKINLDLTSHDFPPPLLQVHLYSICIFVSRSISGTFSWKSKEKKSV